MHSQLPTHQILLEKSMEQVPLRGLTILFKKGWHIPHTWRHRTENQPHRKLALTTKKKGVRRATPQRLKAVTLALPLPTASHQHSEFWDVLRGRILCRAGQWWG